MEMKYYICEACGKIVAMINDTKVPTICCGASMKEIVPAAKEAAVEKHIPVVTVEGNTVTAVVGEVIHPMTEEHYIEWVSMETKEGYQIKDLKPGDVPKVVFTLTDTDEVVAVYAYCNLHGLWKK